MKKIILSVALLLMSGHVWAANYDDPIDGYFKGVYGDTFTIQVPSLVSKSPTTGDQTGDLSFQFRSDTNYQNFHQLTDLSKGDAVRVEYSLDDSKTNVMIAKSISKISADDMANAGAATTDTADTAAGYGSTTNSTTAPSQTTVTTITTTTNPQ